MKPVKADGAKGGRKANPRKPNVMKKKSNRPKPGMNIPGENLYLLKWDTPRLTEEARDDLFTSRYAVEFTWVETSVWTPKMCSTLERGIKGGKWFSLIDKVWKFDNLFSAFKQVKANKGAAGIDSISIDRYEQNLVANLNHLSQQLRENKYSPKTIRRCYITKPGRKKEQRPIGISTVGDGWVRMKLRSILKRHEKKRGIGRGMYHKRYPNAYFADLGLFSLGESKETELSIWKQKS